MNYQVDSFDEFVEANKNKLADELRNEGIDPNMDDIVNLGREIWNEEQSTHYEDYINQEVRAINNN